MVKIRSGTLLLGLAAMLVAGCGGGGSGPEADSLAGSLGPRSISLTGIQSPTKSVYRKGEPITIEYSVGSSGVDAQDVIMNFSLVPTSELALLLADEETSAIALGDTLIESISSGFVNLSADFTIPNDIVGGQEYVIMGSLDPEGRATADGDFSDNLSRNFSAAFDDPTTKVITVADEFINDLSIEDAAVGEGFILLETPANAVAASGSRSAANIVRVADDPNESNAVGHIDVRKLGGDAMSAIIQVDVIIDGQETAAFMWKGENDEWVNEAPYTVPNPNDVHFVPWDIRLSEAQRNALFAAYDPAAESNVATFRFRIQQTDGAQDENPDNNSFELEVPFRFFLPGEAPEEVATENVSESAVAATGAATALKQLGSGATRGAQSSGALRFHRKYSQTYGSKKKFAIRLAAESFNDLNGSAGTGRVYNNARVDGYALGKRLTLARAFGNIEANARAGSAGYRGYAYVFGGVVLDQSRSASTSISRDWGLSWREERTFASSTFFAGPVPIRVSAGASGTVGFGAGLSLDGGVIEGYGDLFYADLDAYAQGGVDAGFAGGGIRAELLLLQHTFRVTGAADLSKLTSRRVTLSANAQNRIRAVEGRFYLYGFYRYFKWCCKFKKREKRVTLYNTGALFKKNWTLLSASQTVTF